MTIQDWNAAVPADATPEDLVLNICFTIVACHSCHHKYSVITDPNSGNFLYFNMPNIPMFPPFYTVATKTPLHCPQPGCLSRENMKIVSRYAVVSKEGHWLYLDKGVMAGG